MFYVYLLKSINFDELYIGSTNDLKRRLIEHNNKTEFSTKRYVPWDLIYYEAFCYEKDARMREQKLKQHGNAKRHLYKRLHLGLSSTTFRRKASAGFTLIELILYVAIMAIVIGALIPFSWNVIGNGVKSSYQQEVYSQARFISEKIKSEVRNAKGINSVSATSLSLQNFTPASDPTVIDLSGGKIRIQQGGGTVFNLNSNDTTITNLNFTNNTSGDNKTKNISYTFTISNNTGSVRQEYQADVTIQASAEVRSN